MIDYLNLSHTTMEFPDEILEIIRAFSNPLTRVDWRTCKRHETRLILIHQCMSMFNYLHMLEYGYRQPILDGPWDADDAKKVIGLLATYAKAKADFEEATKHRQEYQEWRRCELAHRGSLVQLMIGLVGLQEYARIRGYDTE